MLTDKQKLEIVLREIKAIGLAWRQDWSDFDGRTLRDQLDTIADWGEREQERDTLVEGTDFLGFIEQRYR